MKLFYIRTTLPQTGELQYIRLGYNNDTTLHRVWSSLLLNHKKEYLMQLHPFSKTIKTAAIFETAESAELEFNEISDRLRKFKEECLCFYNRISDIIKSNGTLTQDDINFLPQNLAYMASRLPRARARYIYTDLQNIMGKIDGFLNRKFEFVEDNYELKFRDIDKNKISVTKEQGSCMLCGVTLPFKEYIAIKEIYLNMFICPFCAKKIGNMADNILNRMSEEDKNDYNASKLITSI